MVKIKLKKGFVMRRILGEWVIVPVGACRSGTSVMSVNESGRTLWELLGNGATEDELLSHMLDEYEIDTDTAARDIKNFVGVLLEKKVAVLVE
jgi:hypothetical protein